MKASTLPQYERPREKLLRYGPTKLSNVELLAILLGTGTFGQNVIELSRQFLVEYGVDRLPRATVAELLSRSGLGLKKAATIVAAMELGRRLLRERPRLLIARPRDVWLAMGGVRAHRKEHVIAFYLDSQQQLIAQEVISVGTIDASLVHPREVFEPAIKLLASQIILAHNHPSGQLEPSAEDLLLTDRLVQAGQILGIEVVDHIIVTATHYLSLRNGQLL